jgi:hypothetical protein
MKLKNETKKTILSLLGEPIMQVEVTEDMMEDIYADAVKKFDFYATLSHKTLNQVKEQWVENFFQASVKETLAHIRGKFSGQLPIPGTELTLSFKELLTTAVEEKKHLISLFF